MPETLVFGILVVATGGLIKIHYDKAIKTDRVRRAILIELNLTTAADPIFTHTVGPGTLKTPVIDGNLGNLHLLKGREIHAVLSAQMRVSEIRSLSQESPDDIPPEMIDTANDAMLEADRMLRKSRAWWLRWTETAFPHLHELKKADESEMRHL